MFNRTTPHFFLMRGIPFNYAFYPYKHDVFYETDNYIYYTVSNIIKGGI